MALNQAELYKILSSLPAPCGYCVAYSGGRDSHVLLHAMAGLCESTGARLRAAHVDHGLHADSANWADHCVRICDDLGVTCHRLRVEIPRAGGAGLESAAREARYRALAELLDAGEMLLAAHHREDQAETVLLQLLRGAGPAGLAAMPVIASFGPGYLARPLLGFSSAEIRTYAEGAALRWIEDPSNQHPGIDRNFLRHRVFPVLKQRWPTCSLTLARAAANCAEASGLVDELAASELHRLAREDGTLSVSGLARLDEPRRKAAIRSWIRQRGIVLPNARHLARISGEMLSARPDGEPRVCWGDVEVRRYRDGLYLLRRVPAVDADRVYSWGGSEILRLSGEGGMLRARRGPGSGIKRELWEHGSVTVRFRRGGEVCRPAGRGHRHSLKKMFQEAGIPPWDRDRIPLIYVNDSLAAVPGLGCFEPFQSAAGEPAVQIEWLAHEMTPG